MQAVRSLTFSSSKTSLRRYSHTKTFPKVSSSNNTSILWSARSFTASVASHSPEEPITPRTTKRLSKDERAKSIIDFVNKYRASNAGKFPSATATRNQAGGSHYTVKKILQQLQHNAKHGFDKESHASPVDNKDAEDATTSSALSSTTFFSEADLIHQKIGEPSSLDKTHSDQIKLERNKVTVPLKNMDMDMDTIHSDQIKLGRRTDLCNDEADNIKEASSFDSNMDMNEPKVAQENVEEPSNADKMQGDILDKRHSDQLNLKQMEMSHPHNVEAETSNNAASSDASLDSIKPKVLQENVQEASDHNTLERSELPRDTSTKEDEGNESAQKPTIWGSLRSFADGIINLWKNK